MGTMGLSTTRQKAPRCIATHAPLALHGAAWRRDAGRPRLLAAGRLPSIIARHGTTHPLSSSKGGTCHLARGAWMGRSQKYHLGFCMTPRDASRPADAAVGRPSENGLPAIACVMAEPLDSGPLNPTSSNALSAHRQPVCGHLTRILDPLQLF